MTRTHNSDSPLTHALPLIVSVTRPPRIMGSQCFLGSSLSSAVHIPFALTLLVASLFFSTISMVVHYSLFIFDGSYPSTFVFFAVSPPLD